MACLISQNDFLQFHANQFIDNVRPCLDFEKNILSQSSCLALADGQKSVMKLSFFVGKNLHDVAARWYVFVWDWVISAFKCYTSCFKAN